MKRTAMLKIKFEFYITMVALVVLVVVLSAFSTVITTTLWKSSAQTISSANQMSFDTVFSHMQNEVSGVMKTCSYFMESARLKRNLAQMTNQDVDMYDKVLASKELSGMLNMAITQSALITDIGINTGENFYAVGPTLGVSDGKHFMNQLDIEYTTKLELKPLPQVDGLSGKHYFSFTFTDAGGAVCNTLVLIKEDFSKLFASNPKEWAIMDKSNVPLSIGIFEAQDIEIAKSFEAILNETTKNNEREFYSEVLSGFGWTVIYHPSEQTRQSYWVNVMLWLITLLLLCVCIFFVLAKCMAKRIVRPVHLFANLLKAYHQHNQDENEEHEIICVQKAFSIRENLFAFLLVTILVPSTVFLIVFSLTAGKEINSLETLSQKAVVENLAQNMSSFFHSKEQALERIVYSEAVLKAMAKKNNESGDKNSAIYETVEENIYFSLDNGAVNLYDAAGEQIFSNNMFAKKNLLPEQLIQQIGWTVQKNLLNQTSFVFTQKNVDFNNFSTLGFTQLAYQYDDIMNQKEFNGETSALLVLIDENGNDAITLKNIVSKGLLNPETTSQAVTAETGTWQVAPVAFTDWSIAMSAIPKKGGFFENLILVNKQMLIMTYIAVAAAMYALSYVLIRPINRTNRMLQCFEPGNPEIRLDEYSFIDEIGEISKSFNDMATRIDELIDDIIINHHYTEKLESEKKNAEITALQMQINPHFLSNTIETISSIIQEGETEKAKEMLYALNNLFRYGISKADYIIPIREEIQNSKAYTDIMKVRHSKVDFVWEVDPEVLECCTIKLLLQPLIENAIYHGLYKTQKEGVVRIQISKSDDNGGENVRFCVQDDGVGISQDALAALYVSLEDKKEQGRIGLYNVQSRLRLHYGVDCILQITSQPGKGTEVIVNIPTQYNTIKNGEEFKK